MSEDTKKECAEEEPKWESLCPECGRSCPEIWMRSDGSVEIRDTKQHDKTTRLNPEELRTLLLRTLVVG